MRCKKLLPALVFLFHLLIQCKNNTGGNSNDAAPKSKSSVIVSSQMNASRTIAENIQSDSSHSVFAEALQSAGLMETLSQSGPFTVFAPTNDAFRKLPAGTYESLLQNRKKDLGNILSYHIVAGSLKTKDMKDGEKLRTLTGEEVIITLRKKKVLVNGIDITTRDIEAGNGIIYVIDGILFPRNQNAGSYQP